MLIHPPHRLFDRATIPPPNEQNTTTTQRNHAPEFSVWEEQHIDEERNREGHSSHSVIKQQVGSDGVHARELPEPSQAQEHSDAHWRQGLCQCRCHDEAASLCLFVRALAEERGERSTGRTTPTTSHQHHTKRTSNTNKESRNQHSTNTHKKRANMSGAVKSAEGNKSKASELRS